ncbi:MAG: AraC family transcriptional regulator [Oscillospiraceae bacterium]|jgi:AraC-like DNA-binding protein|nr:AraC family transcriptional regulator [Oscillospiraceae bacterium]
MRGFTSGAFIVTHIENVARITGERASQGKAGAGANAHSLIFMMRGSRTVQANGARLVGKPGSVFFLPQGGVYKTECSDDCDGVLIKFVTQDEVQTKPFVFNPVKINKWQTLFTSIESAWMHQKPGAAERCMSLIYQAVAMTIEACVRVDLPSTRQASLEKSLEYLESNLKQPAFSVESMAPVSGMCPTYFRQQFRRMYGVSPKQYLLNMRIRLAKDLLATTDMFVTAVAQESGFSSLYYFSKAFKGATGKSPRAYRESIKG